MHIPRHRVVLRQRDTPGETVEEVVEAATPALAASMMETRHRDCEAVEVWTLTEFRGRCAKCRSFLSVGGDVRRARGKLICGECP